MKLQSFYLLHSCFFLVWNKGRKSLDIQCHWKFNLQLCDNSQITQFQILAPFQIHTISVLWTLIYATLWHLLVFGENQRERKKVCSQEVVNLNGESQNNCLSKFWLQSVFITFSLSKCIIKYKYGKTGLLKFPLNL